MKITVLNGSPKGITSVTMQYIHYIQKQFPQHELKIFNISQNIAKIQKDEDYFNGILDEITSSNGVLWASPVYYLLIPANLKRFIELISERKAEDRLRNTGYAVNSTCPIMLWLATYNHLTRHRGTAYCLLHQPVKKQSTRSGCTPVKSEGKFIKIIFKMRRADSTLMNTEPPAI